MIGHLTGTIIEVLPASIVVDVHGVGYLVFISAREGLSLNAPISLFTYLAVRENALDLYGFSKLEDKQMFEHLIKLPKIGPKTALQILSQADVPTIRRAVETDDATYLTKMSGIGKKSAEKIVDGLRDVIGDDGYTLTEGSTHRDSDVIDALLTLGYSERDVRDAVQRIPASLEGTNARIKHALKELSS